ncbi:glutathione binding-like protein [Acetobacter cerevisiae]|uniref:Glutathione S-transferase n=1 Tax=Acetobacter cerevisiae TaxID=178900 RepID=A0A149V801_9PROT|nr:glutathione S-transferase C-terminal domain-containing protein [Acetobacter cerevisiae]KXV76053.1 glutathione S-transferase [Acetobacter cerevisiae]
MIDLFYWPTPNGHKITLFLEEAGMDYTIHPVDITAGDQFRPVDIRGRASVTEWLFWQVGGLGPMAGQNHHFVQYTPEKIPYAITRYVNETNRLYGVMDRRLAQVPFLGGADYSIADMASYPWIVPWKGQQENLEEFPHLKRWLEDIGERPATIRAYEKGKALLARPAKG